ncbi:MAG: hypothetical protein L0Y66_25540 [Myxococcaceae bacterium]|nr:hypothetical protein [Myxococcaceae bacterium]MCI0670160.1 hypothetical protein [Myxococcaceae bacterium]
MGAFADFFSSSGLDPKKVLRTSTRLEAQSLEGRVLSQKRANKRRTAKDKSYADAGIAKPPRGRGFGASHFKNAMADRPVPVKVRSKLLKAINEQLAKAKKPAVDMKAVFGDVAAAKGESSKAKK